MNNWKMVACGNAAEIDVTGPIGEGWYEDGVTAKAFIRDLKAMGDVETITMRIFSPGGSVMEGNAIFNALVQHPAKITAQVDFAASMATIIAMAADEIHMADNGFFMIHNPWSVALGDAEEMRKTADLLDKIKANAVKAYARHSNKSEAEIAEMMDAETWMTAEEAMEAGFVHSITPEVRAAAACDLSILKNVPEGAQAFLDASLSIVDPVEPPADPIIEPESEVEPEEEPQALLDPAVMKAKIDEAYDAGMAAGEAKLAALIEAATAEMKTNLEKAEQSANAAQSEVEKLQTERDALNAKIESITAGFEYEPEGPPKSSRLADHPYHEKMRELKESGLTDAQASKRIDQDWPHLRQDLIKQANRK